MQTLEIIRIYEQLLAQNPTYRKHLGAFYTDEWIVKYMVETVCNELFKHKTYTEICQTTILDLCCGGGAFLLGAYEFLLAYHSSQRQKILTLQERKEILFRQIFGVDIDQEAVNICKQVLLMLCYQTDNPQEVEVTLLNHNIKVGNSLVSRFSLTADLSQALKKSKYTIETYRMAVQTYRNAQNKEQKREMERLIAQIKNDFRTEISKNDPKLVKKRKLEAELFLLTHQISVFATNEKEKQTQLAQIETLTAEIEKLEAEIAQVQNNPLFLRAFEWRFEFPEVLDNEGNFIGFDVIIGNPPYISNKEIKPLQKEFFQTYQTAKLQYDLFSLFIEKSVILLRQNGIGSYIIPDSFLARSTFKTIREYLYHNTTLYKLLQIDNVFDEAAVSSCVIFFTKSLLNNPKPIEYLKTKNAKTFEAHEIETKQINYLTHEKINSYRLLFIDEHELKLLIKLFQNIPFETHIHIWRGEEIGKKSSLISENQFDSTMLPIITGENIERYYFKGKIKFISQSSILKDTIQYNKPKIFIRQLGTSIHAHLAEGNIITTQSVYCLYSVNQKYSNEIILAILNSKLTHFIYKCVFAEKQQFPRILIENIRNLVLPQPNEKIFKQIKVLVDKILSLKRQDQQADTSGLEAEIDRLVYALYDLTETEIKIIERA